MSLFLGKPAHLKHPLQLLSLYTGMVIHQSITNFMNANITLKWPNDIMIGSRKCGGVLTEIQWLGEQDAADPLEDALGRLVGLNVERC